MKTRVNSDPVKREQRYDLMVRRSYARYRRRVKRGQRGALVAYASIPGDVARVGAMMKMGDILYILPRQHPNVEHVRLTDED